MDFHNSIFYDPKTQLDLSQYGIQIPMVDDRSRKVYDFIISKNIKVNTNTSNWPSLNTNDLRLVHTKDMVQRLDCPHRRHELLLECFELQDEHYPGRYKPEDAVKPLITLYDKILKQCCATAAALKHARQYKFAYFLGGGYHHAMSDRPRGFCLLNDIALALKKNEIESAWIIDVDAHKGDGTAEIFQFNDKVKTLSLHMERGWPLDTPNLGQSTPWHLPSDIDIPIAQGHEDYYLSLLKEGLQQLDKLERPEMVVIVQGSDPYELDQLESAKLLRLNQEQLLQRDKIIYHFLNDRNLAQAYVMGGGYGHHAHQIYINFFNWLFSLS